MNLEIYEELTGLDHLPSDRHYWTLANEQPDTEGSEINQLVDAGFLSKQQFYGVDLDQEIISLNKRTHPTAHWITGDWLNVISNTENFNPGLIYLDSVYFADNILAAQTLARTMLRTPAGTVLLFNVQSKSGYARQKTINCDALIDRLPNYLPSRELACWRTDYIPSFTYTGSRTEMRTFVFYKEN